MMDQRSQIGYALLAAGIAHVRHFRDERRWYMVEFLVQLNQ